MARRNGRQRNQLPTTYYEGYLEKRSFKDKVSRKLWSCLCGNVLYFFNDKRESDYVEKLDLSQVISITDDSSPDRNLDAARFTVTTKDGNIKLTAPNTEARELWKGFMLSLSEMSVPSSFNLLPGQLHMIREAVEAERKRRNGPPAPASAPAPAPAPVVSSKPSDNTESGLPLCYYSVSRLEAELVLQKEAKKGNLLLRPGRDGNSYSITTRQEGHNGAQLRHYRVSQRPGGGFAIALDKPVPCATLQDAVNYLVEKTVGVLIPLVCEEEYEQNIYFIQSDDENGERSIQRAVPAVTPPLLPQRPAFIQSTNENAERSIQRGVPAVTQPPLPPRPDSIQSTNENGERSVQRARPYMAPPPLPYKPVGLKIPTTGQAPAANVEPLNQFGQKERDTEEDSVPALPQTKKLTTVKPPLPAPRKSLTDSSINQTTPSSTSSTNTEQSMRNSSEWGATISQLRQAFEKKSKVVE